jgi:hypothetical protein
LISSVLIAAGGIFALVLQWNHRIIEPAPDRWHPKNAFSSQTTNQNPMSNARTTTKTYQGMTDFVHRGYNNRWQTAEGPPVSDGLIAGQGPFGKMDLWQYLDDRGLKTYLNFDKGDDPGVLIVGRDGYDLDAIKALLDDRRGTVLRICSQEMILAWSLTGVDPNARADTARSFIEGHPALEAIATYLNDDWPGTDPLPRRGNGEAEFDAPEKGPLKRLGYEVGKTGARTSVRQRALRKAFNLAPADLPGTYPHDYLADWGAAESSKRLEKIANSLASNCRTARKRSTDMSAAIDDWERDLDWLRREFYNPLTFSFRWPDTRDS